MLLKIPDVLTPDELGHVRQVLDTAPWIDGRATAGDLATQAKCNAQLPADGHECRALGDLVLAALARCPTFQSAALPRRILPPLFNRYDTGMAFGLHTDNAIRIVPGTSGAHLRADVSATLFLSEPNDYDGGELVIEDTYGTHAVKLAAGHLVLYPASSLHRVAPVTRGRRRACVFWAQSLVRDDGERALLYDLDVAIIDLRTRMGDGDGAVQGLVSHYHNLLRRWAEL